MYDESSEQKFPFKNPSYLAKKKEQKQVKSSKQNKTIRNLCLNEMTQFPERLNCNNNLPPHFHAIQFCVRSPS